MRQVCPSGLVVCKRNSCLESWDCTQSASFASDIVAAIGELCSSGVLARRSGQHPGWLSGKPG